MKKILPPTLLFAILVIGLIITFSYQVPETKTYTALNTIDTKIDENMKINNQTMAKNLSQLQSAVTNLIAAGESYTEGTDVKTAFEQFETSYQNIQILQEELTKLMKVDLIAKLENTTSKLVDEQKKLAEEAIQLETTRLNELANLLKQIETLNSKLSKTEEMFYTQKPSVAVQYFNGLNNEFLALEQTYKTYADASTNYFTAKSNLYESIIK